MVRDRRWRRQARRTSGQGVLGAVRACVSGLLLTAMPAEAEEERSITVLSWGGAYEEAQREAWFDPFTEATGIEVEVERYSGGLRELRGEADSGHASWDVVDLTMSDALAACEEGLIQPLDPGMLRPGPEGTPPRRDFLDGALTECAIAHTVFATVVAYDRTAFPGRRPTAIGDLFDLERFPGPRALQRAPTANLEWALLSYNVPLEELYELLSTRRGLQLAFRRLASLGDAVRWWDAPEEPARLLADGEVVMASGYNGRFFDVMVNEDASIEILWDAQIREFETWAVPRNAEHPEAARAFIRFATRSDRLVAFARHLPYGPARHSGAQQVTTHAATGIDMRLHIPTHPLNSRRAVRKDESWYASVHDRINERFSAWLAEWQERTGEAAPESAE